MRVIGGQYGGRKITPPTNMPHTRPTTDIAREGLFNILENNLEIEGMKSLDLFGGTGSISYELASRGATDITIVEKDFRMHAFITKTAGDLGLEEFQVLRVDVFAFLKRCESRFNFIFAGPPYALVNIDDLPKLVLEKKLLLPGGWFVLEHTPRNNYEGYPWFVSKRNYGTTVFSIFVNKEG